MSSSEFSEWMAFFAEEPFGDRRTDLQAAIIASTVANVNRTKDSAPVPLETFLVPWTEAEREDRERRQERALEEKMRRAFGR